MQNNAIVLWNRSSVLFFSGLGNLEMAVIPDLLHQSSDSALLCRTASARFSAG